MLHAGGKGSKRTGTITSGKAGLQSIAQISNKDVRNMSEEIDERSCSNGLEDKGNHSVVSIKSAKSIGQTTGTLKDSHSPNSGHDDSINHQQIKNDSTNEVNHVDPRGTWIAGNTLNLSFRTPFAIKIKEYFNDEYKEIDDNDDEREKSNTPEHIQQRTWISKSQPDCLNECNQRGGKRNSEDKQFIDRNPWLFTSISKHHQEHRNLSSNENKNEDQHDHFTSKPQQHDIVH